MTMPMTVMSMVSVPTLLAVLPVHAMMDTLVMALREIAQVSIFKVVLKVRLANDLLIFRHK